jgi:chemotaxis protein MotB
VGLSDTVHLDNGDPFNPINRRISIIVLNKESEEAIRSELIGQSSSTSVQSVPEALELGRDIEDGLNAPPDGVSIPRP